jgi:hypothetical protein
MSVEVRYFENFGNNLYQYAFGRLVAEARGGELVCVPEHERQGAHGLLERQDKVLDRLAVLHPHLKDCPQTIQGRRVESPQIRYVWPERHGWDGYNIDMTALMRNHQSHRIVLRGCFAKSSYFEPHRDRLRGWLSPRSRGDMPRLNPDDVVIHIRRARDFWYLRSLLSLEYYRRVLTRLAPARTVVTGIGIDERVKQVLAPFNPDYSFADLNGIDTFRLLCNANRLVISNSSFSWWAAFLSHAEEIIAPRPHRGLFSREHGTHEFEFSGCTVEEDVEVEAFTPCMLRRDRVRGVVRLDEGHLLRVQSRSEEPVDIPVEAHYMRFVEWLLDQREPIGPDQWFPTLDECPDKIPPVLVRLIELDVVATDTLLLQAHLERIQRGAQV